MPVRRLPLVVAAVLVPLIASAQGAAAPRKLRVAVLEVRPLGTEPEKADLLSEIALTEAASIPGVEVIGRSDINSMLGFEKQKRVVGCSEDSSCLAEIGGALGVEYIMVGSLGRIGTLYRLDLKLVDAKKARVRNRMGVTVERREESLVAAVQKMVRALLLPEVPATFARNRTDDRAAGGGAEKPGDGATARATANPKAARRTWAYATGGLGVALLAGGAVAGLQARSAFEDEKSATTVAQWQDSKDKARSMSYVADGLFVAGAACAGVGTYLFLTSRAPALAVVPVPVRGGAVASLTVRF